MVSMARPAAMVHPARASVSSTARLSVRAPMRRAPVRMNARAEEAAEADDDDFESKLASLKGKRTSGQGVKAAKRIAKADGKDVALEEAYKAPIDFSDEVILYEGPPATGDLVTNLALGATLIWLPLTLASVGRYIWLKYKFTDKRIVMESSSPLDSGTTQITYDQITKVVTIGRGVGLWGDMVITLKNGDNVEFRSLPNFKDLEAGIREKMPSSQSKDADAKGF